MKYLERTTLTLCCVGTLFSLGCGTASKNADNGAQATPAPQTVAPQAQPVTVEQLPAVQPAATAADTTTTPVATASETPVATASTTATPIQVTTLGAPQYIVTVTDNTGAVVDQKAIDLTPNQIYNPTMLGQAMAGGMGMGGYASAGGVMRGGNVCFGRWCQDQRGGREHHQPDQRFHAGEAAARQAAADASITLTNSGVRVGYGLGAHQPVALGGGRMAHVYQRGSSLAN